jgi:hypothetical protein
LKEEGSFGFPIRQKTASSRDYESSQINPFRRLSSTVQPEDSTISTRENSNQDGNTLLQFMSARVKGRAPEKIKQIVLSNWSLDQSLRDEPLWKANTCLLSEIAVQFKTYVPLGSHANGILEFQDSFTGADMIVYTF